MNLAIAGFSLGGAALIALLWERTRSARRLREQRSRTEQLERTDRLRDDMVATISHQLKTPLTSVLGYASLIKRKHGSLSAEQLREYVDVIESQAMRVTRLVEDLLQTTRIEHPQGIQRTQLDLVAILRAAAQEIGDARGRTVDILTPQADLDVWGDRGALEHVIGNLLDNAVKYSEGGTPITVEVSDGEGEVAVTVRDHGIGIEPDELPWIFERFRRARSAPRSSASVGLGLFIVRNLVAAHGGRVWADSEPGKGTTVGFTLPRRRR